MGTGTSDSWHFGTTSTYTSYSSWHSNDPNNTNPFSQVTAPIPANAQWHYVVSTFDNTTKEHKIYVDGSFKATTIFNSTIGYDNNKMYLGAALENGNLSFPMWGRLDDVKIYDAALTAQQIFNEYIASISFNNPGSGNAVSFNGSQDNFVQLPSMLDGTNIFTTDFWVKTSDNRSSGLFWQKPTLIGNANPAFADGDFGITINNGQIAVWSGICSCGDQELQTTKTINDDKWHHVAVVSDGTSMVLYVDGMLMPGSISTSGGALQTLARPWFVGKNNSCCSDGSPVIASMDELRIWNTALTQSQIRDRMCSKTTNIDPLFGNLLGYYHFNEAVGYAAIDSKNSNQGYINNSTRIGSGAAIGDASAHDYVSAIKTTGINNSNGESFAVTSASGNPDGIQVYSVNAQPNTMSGAIPIGAANKYFGVFQIGGSSPQYNAVYNYSSNPYVTASNESSLALYKRTDNSATAWTNSSAAQDMIANTMSVTGQSTEYLLGSSIALPLQLLSFSAGRQGEIALLQWKTTDEINTSHFEIERSTNGVRFEKIGNVAAANALGIHNYLFTDAAPAKGINYYRLKQIDRDGRFTYSAVATVIFESDNAGLKVYPNPAINNITVQYTGFQKKFMLNVYDAAGRKVLSKDCTDQNILQVDVSRIGKGIYVVELNDGGKLMFGKLVKL